MRNHDLTDVINGSVTPGKLSKALKREWEMRRRYEQRDFEGLEPRSRRLRRNAIARGLGVREPF